MIAFRPPQPGDAEAIAADMRDIDAVECRSWGHAPLDAVRAGLAGSIEPEVAVGLHGPVCALGIIPVSVLDGLARPWLLGTRETPRHARVLLTAAPPRVAVWQAQYPRLENWVHRDNAASIRWLKFLGFAVEDELVHIGAEPFRRFTKGF